LHRNAKYTYRYRISSWRVLQVKNKRVKRRIEEKEWGGGESSTPRKDAQFRLRIPFGFQKAYQKIRKELTRTVSVLLASI